MPPPAKRLPGTPPGPGATAPPLLALLLLLACWAGACGGAPILLQELQPEEELQLWNEIEAACSSFLPSGSQPQASDALEELCFTIMGTLPKPQKTDEKVNNKRFLFHYSKTGKLGNSNVVSSVVHPLLQLVPQLHERRMKRLKLNLPSRKMAAAACLKRNVKGTVIAFKITEFPVWKESNQLLSSFLKGEFQGPIASHNRRYFLFRPRNGKRSEDYI